ncbi:MAG: sensor histidine kinase, partial [Oscillospiraceae bacterium]
MALKSIAQRWFINSFAVVFVILFAVVKSRGSVNNNLYYYYVKQSLKYRANSVSSTMLQYSASNAGNNFYISMRDYVESFPDKDFVELMAIDPYGN